jgi:hypothetical protein
LYGDRNLLWTRTNYYIYRCTFFYRRARLGILFDHEPRGHRIVGGFVPLPKLEACLFKCILRLRGVVKLGNLYDRRCCLSLLLASQHSIRRHSLKAHILRAVH